MIADVLVIVFIVAFTIRGVLQGFFLEVFRLAGVVTAGFFTFTLYNVVGTFVTKTTGVPLIIANIVSFIVLFIMIMSAFVFVGTVFSKAMKKIKLSGVNRAFGGGFGALKGALIAGILLFLANGALKESGKNTFIENAVIAGPVMEMSATVLGSVRTLIDK